MGVFVNVNASEDQEMITSNQVLEDGFLEETEEEEFLNFSTKVNVDWTVKPQILKRSKGFTKKAGSIIYINLKIFPHKKVRIGVIKGGKVKKIHSHSISSNDGGRDDNVWISASRCFGKSGKRIYHCNKR